MKYFMYIVSTCNLNVKFSCFEWYCLKIRLRLADFQLHYHVKTVVHPTSLCETYKRLRIKADVHYAKDS